MPDKFQVTIANLKGLAQTLSEAPTDDVSSLPHDEVCEMFIHSQTLHKVLGVTLLEAIRQLEKFR